MMRPQGYLRKGGRVRSCPATRHVSGWPLPSTRSSPASASLHKAPDSSYWPDLTQQSIKGWWVRVL